jgi:non-ribosomal peptide synthase protein (TIGR01720 family)
MNLLNNQGYDLSYENIYQTPTLSQLAAQLRPLKSATSELPIKLSWQSLLTPSQEFLLQTIKNPNYWAIPLLFKFESQKVDPDLLRQTISYIFDHHEAFHLRFQKTDHRWVQLYDPAWNTFVSPLEIHDLSTLSDQKITLHINMSTTTAHSLLDIQTGFMTKCILFECGPHRPQRLFFSIHHLICDGLSMIILKEQLELVYKQISLGQSPKLPKNTRSLKDWIHCLKKAAYDPKFTHQLPFWKDQLKSLKFLPYDFKAEQIGPEHQIITHLSVDTTQSILNTLQNFDIKMRVFLLALLIQTLYEWTQNSSISLLLTGHGREQSISTMNLSQTIGPFLSLFPVQFNFNPTQSFTTLCQNISNTLDQIPDHGIGYGILRYLGPQNLQDELACCGIPPLGFNFVGAVDQNESDTLFRSFISEEMGKEREHHSLPLRVAIIILDDHLSFMWSYSQDHFHKTTIQKLISNYMKHLEDALCQLTHT